MWAYRKAAWDIEDPEQDVGLIHGQLARKGLESIEDVGPRLAGVLENLLNPWTDGSALQSKIKGA